MNKLERDTLESLAKRHNTSKRIPVVLPDLPKVGLLMEDREQAWNDDWDEWNRQVIERKVDALLALAKEREADPHELVKVADLLLEVVPPETRGNQGVDRYRVFLLVALEIGKGKSQQLACDLAGVTTKTFRTLKKRNPLEWSIVQKCSASLPESVIRELAATPPGE